MTETEFNEIKAAAAERYFHGKKPNLPLNAKVFTPMFVFLAAATIAGFISVVVSLVLLVNSDDVASSEILSFIAIVSAVMFLLGKFGASDYFWDRQPCTIHQAKYIKKLSKEHREIQDYLIRLDAMGIVPRRYEHERIRSFVERVSPYYDSFQVARELRSIINGPDGHEAKRS